MAALRACNELLPQGMTLRITSIADLPMFNQDVFDAGHPGAGEAAARRDRARPTAC